MLTVIDILLPILKRLWEQFGEDATSDGARSFCEDRWRKAEKRTVKRLATENITVEHVTEVRPTPPAGYVAFVVYRLWAAVLKGGVVVDGFRDASTPKVLALVAGQLNPNDHGHNVRLITEKLHEVTF